eukprot:scaffold275333_cov83-Attheya_sp.AAC.1
MGFQQNEFGVEHYAGSVRYSGAHNLFVMKNNGATISLSDIACIAKSSNELIGSAFGGPHHIEENKATLVHQTVWSTKFQSQLSFIMEIQCILFKKRKAGIGDCLDIYSSAEYLSFILVLEYCQL